MATEQIDTVIDLGTDSGKQPTPGARTPQEAEPEIVVDIVDDRPQQDRNRPPRDPNRPSAQPSDEELGKYTQGVQDRLKQMRWEYHEERRHKEQFQREHAVALDLARRVHQENSSLRKLLSDGHRTLLNSSKQSAENEIKALQESLKAALDAGDTGKAAQLNSEIARAAARGEATNHVAPLQFEEDQGPPPGWQPPQQQQQQPQRVQLSNEMQSWTEENPWFGGKGQVEQEMTALAFATHNRLFNSGVRPESPDYFREINDTVRNRFSDYFEDKPAGREQATRQSRPQVAAATRTAPTRGDSRRVALTLSELGVAKRLGVSPEQYAREKTRLEQQDNG